MKHYYSSPVEPFLRRDRKHRMNWKTLGRILLLYVAFTLAVFLSLCVWGATHASAHEMSYTGVMRGGELITKQSFCKTL